MKKPFILLVIFIAMLFSTPAFADFPQPPLDFSLAKCEIEVYHFQFDPSLQEKYGFTERVQAQWRGCFDGIDFMFSYMRRGEDDFAGPDYFSLITGRLVTESVSADWDWGWRYANTWWSFKAARYG